MISLGLMRSHIDLNDNLSGSGVWNGQQPLHGAPGTLPIRVWWKILSPESFHPHPWGGWSGTLWADWVSPLLLSSLSPRGKRPSQLLLHPKHPSFTLRPCDARLGFWPGDCWRWKGSTGQLKFCNNMTLRPADLSCLLPSSWRFWSLFLRLCRRLIMVRVTLWVHGRVHSSKLACWTCVWFSPPLYQEFFLQPGRQCTW